MLVEIVVRSLYSVLKTGWASLAVEGSRMDRASTTPGTPTREYQAVTEYMSSVDTLCAVWQAESAVAGLLKNSDSTKRAGCRLCSMCCACACNGRMCDSRVGRASGPQTGKPSNTTCQQAITNFLVHNNMLSALN